MGPFDQWAKFSQTGVLTDFGGGEVGTVGKAYSKLISKPAGARPGLCMYTRE